MKNAFRILCWAVVLFALPLARANDSAVEGVGGTIKPMGREHPFVRMVRESVTMDLYPNYYETVADFTFANQGAASIVQMGFPESGMNGRNDVGTGKTGGFLRFATRVDGKPLAVRRVGGKYHDTDRYQAYWVKQVPFTVHQTRQVQVRLRCPYGLIAGNGMSRWASYSFTGGNWQGKVDASVLTVRLHEPGTFLVGPSFQDRKRKMLPRGWMSQKGTVFTHTFRNWEAEGDFMFFFGKTAPGWLAAPDEPIGGRPDGASNQQIAHATIAGKVPDAQLGYDYTPPAMQADDVTYLKVEDLTGVLEPLLSARKLTMTVKGEDTARVTLVIGTQTFVYEAGSSIVRINGELMPLPVPPKRIRDRSGKRLMLYVPLNSLMKALGGWADVSGGTHTLVVRPLPTAQAAKG